MKFTAVAISVFCLLYHTEIISSSENECNEERNSTKAVKLSVISKRNQSGDLVTYFSLSKRDSDSAPIDVVMDLSQEETECGGKTTVLIRGVLSDQSNTDTEKKIKPEEIRFHSKCGSNVAIMNNGRTLQKINLDEPLFSVAYTNRPLIDGELFEVTLDKKNNKFSNSLGIGVTPFPPTEFKIPKHINNFPLPSWAMYHSHLYHNGSEFMKNYGSNFDALVVGNRIGVMRSNTGTLHYFVNGVDQGPAASDIPNPVYGLLELYRDAGMVTIVARP